MAFYAQGGPSRGQLQSQILGESLGKSLGDFTSDYLINKKVNEIMDNPANKSLSPAEKQQALQRGLGAYGKRAEGFLSRSLELEKQKYAESALSEIEKSINPKTGVSKLSPIQLQLRMAKLGLVSPNFGKSLAPFAEQIAQYGATNSYNEALDEYNTSGGGGFQNGQQNDQVEMQEGGSPQGYPQGGMQEPTTSSGMNIKNQGNTPAPQAQPVGQQTSQNAMPARKFTPIEGLNQNQQEAADTESERYISERFPHLGKSPSRFGKRAFYNAAPKVGMSISEEGARRKELSKRFPAPIVERMITREKEEVEREQAQFLKEYNLDKDMVAADNAKWQEIQQMAPKTLAPYLDMFDGEKIVDTKGNTIRVTPGNPSIIKGLTDRYYALAQQEDPNQTVEAIDAKVFRALKPDINAFNSLKNIPGFGSFIRGDVGEVINGVKRGYKPLLGKGYDEALKEDAAFNKDMGPEETHETLYGDTTSKKSINDIANVKYDVYKYANIPGIPIESQQGHHKRHEQTREKYVENLSNALKNIQPEDDLILLRAPVLNNGGDEKEFIDALTLAQENGLKLSEFQKDQLTELATPRTPPMHEFFNTSSWNKIINYIRGKK